MARPGMQHVGPPDHLAELVRSPSNGLSVRSSVRSIPERKTSIYWDAELSEMVDSPTYNIARENCIDRRERFTEKMVEMNTSLAKDNAQDKTTIALGVVETTRSSSAGLKDGRTRSDIPVSDELHISTRPIEILTGDLTDMKIRGTFPPSPITGNLLQKVQDLRKFKATDALVLSPPSRCKELDDTNTKLMEDRPKKSVDVVSACVLPLENLETRIKDKLQSPSESDIGIQNRLRGGKERFISKRKGKEKVVLSGDMKEEAREDSDGYESVESCNTARLFGARKSRAEKFIGGCKRAKMQVQETPDYTSLTRSDGSFVNWISTLANGLSRPDYVTEKKGLIASRVQDHKRGKMGFQSLFGSLHQPKSEQDQALLSSDAVEKSIENNGSSTTKPSSQDDHVLAEQNIVSNESQNLYLALEEQDPLMHSGFRKRCVASFPSECKTSALPLSTQDTSLSSEEKKADESVLEHSNLWLTHFCPIFSGMIPTSANHSKGLKKSDIPLGCVGKKVDSILHPHRFNSSEAMASIFSKRVDALKQILQTNLVNKATASTITCFFCGAVGHKLRDCPQVTNTEVYKLLNEMTTYNGAEDPCCLCIKCFQLNHWAVACPNAPSLNKSGVQQRAAVLHEPGLGEKLHLELPDGIDLSLEVGESPASLRRIPPSCSLIGKQVVEKPRGIFEVVRSLRLSRTDILKYSMASTTYLDGYYVRLRLGKPEERLGGSGYHVACITSLQGEGSMVNIREPISVMVGGRRCSFEIQFISNQDFLEEELMAWWSVMVRGGGKIPSEDELMLKVNERRRLGL
ncbi:hypothetical protein V2J09_011462 [Rumex salicifolius]